MQVGASGATRAPHQNTYPPFKRAEYTGVAPIAGLAGVKIVVRHPPPSCRQDRGTTESDMQKRRRPSTRSLGGLQHICFGLSVISSVNRDRTAKPSAEREHMKGTVVRWSFCSRSTFHVPGFLAQPLRLPFPLQPGKRAREPSYDQGTIVPRLQT